MTTEIIAQVRSDDGVDFVAVRYQGQLWGFVFHSDPGLDFAIDPQGRSHTDIWDPTGPYTHPMVPAELFEQVEELLTASI